jgi:hypothetical protein
MADYYGSWYPAFTLTGISLICASVTLLLEPVVSRYGMGKTCFIENVDNELASRVKVNGVQDSNEGNLKNADTAETDLP